MNNYTQPEDSNFKQWIYLVSGISAIGVAVSYIFITTGFVIAGPRLPESGIGWIKYLDGKLSYWWMIIILSILTDILYIPITIGLYELLKKFHKGLILFSGILLNLFVLLELAISWMNFPTIINLVSLYNASSSEIERTLYLSSIEYASRLIDNPVGAFYMIFIPSAGVILANIVMIKSKIFGMVIPWIGLISGICNAFSVIGDLFYEPLGQLVVPGSTLAIFWFLGMGIKFLRIKNFNN